MTALRLPKLVATGTLDGSTARPEIHHASPGPDRKRRRSRFFPGPGIAMGQTLTAGTPDFPSDEIGITLSPGGPGAVIPCRKCTECGHSVTDGGSDD